MAQPLTASQWLSQSMKPLSSCLLVVIQVLNWVMVSGAAQYPAPPAEVDAITPNNNFLPATPQNPVTFRGTSHCPSPCRFLQFSQTSFRQTSDPPVSPSYQLLQAWGWQKSMALSASTMMGTKQLKATPPVSALGTVVPWQTATSSGETMINLVPKAALRSTIMPATVLGVALQLSMSRSTPSRPYFCTAATTELTKVEIVELLVKTYPQLPFCPPTEMITFFPLFCHFLTKSVGKFASSTVMLPSMLVLTKARMTNEALGLMSSSTDCPQKSPLNPQQKMEVEKAEQRPTNTRSNTSLGNINIFN